MTTPNKSDEAKTNDEKAEAQSQINVSAPDIGVKKEYVVVDLVLYLMSDNVNGKRRTTKYNRGSTVELDDNVARTLLAEPRPSVVAKDEDKDAE